MAAEENPKAPAILLACLGSSFGTEQRLFSWSFLAGGFCSRAAACLGLVGNLGLGATSGFALAILGIASLSHHRQSQQHRRKNEFLHARLLPLPRLGCKPKIHFGFPRVDLGTATVAQTGSLLCRGLAIRPPAKYHSAKLRLGFGASPRYEPASNRFGCKPKIHFGFRRWA